MEVEFTPDGPSFLELIQEYMERKLDGLFEEETDGI